MTLWRKKEGWVAFFLYNFNIMETLNKKNVIKKTLKNNLIATLTIIIIINIIISVILFTVLLISKNDLPKFGYSLTFSLSILSILIPLLISIGSLVYEKIVQEFYTKIMFSDLFIKAFSITDDSTREYNFDNKINFEEFVKYAKLRSSASSADKEYYEDIINCKNASDIRNFFIKNKELLSENKLLKNNNISLIDFLLINDKLIERNILWHHSQKEREWENGGHHNSYSKFREFFSQGNTIHGSYVLNNFPLYLLPSENQELISKMNKNLKLLIDNIIYEVNNEEFKVEEYLLNKRRNYSNFRNRIKWISIDSYFTYNQNTKTLLEACQIQREIDKVFVPENKKHWSLGKLMSDIEKLLDFFGTLKQDMVHAWRIPNDFIACKEIYELNQIIIKNKHIIKKAFDKLNKEINDLKDNEFKDMMKIWIKAIVYNFENTYLWIDKLYSKRNFMNSLFLTIHKAREDITNEFVNRGKIFFNYKIDSSINLGNTYKNSRDIFNHEWNQVNEIAKISKFVNKYLITFSQKIDLSIVMSNSFIYPPNVGNEEKNKLTKQRVLEIYVKEIIWTETMEKIFLYIKSKEEKKAE